MEVTGRRNNLFRVLDSVESATILGTSRRPGQTAARAQGITATTTFVHASTWGYDTPFSCAWVRAPAHGGLPRNPAWLAGITGREIFAGWRGQDDARQRPVIMVTSDIVQLVQPATIMRVLLCACGLLVLLPLEPQAGGAQNDKVDFNFQVRPLLSDRCFPCHGPDAKTRMSKLRLDSKETALKALTGGMFIIKPGDPSKSE